MTLIFAQNRPKSLISIILEYLIVGSCIFVYLSYTIITNLNLYKEPIYNIRINHTHLNIGVINTEVKYFLEAKLLNLKNILDDEEILKNENFEKIFFIETHVDEVRTLNEPRIACSVESAGRKKLFFI